MKKTFLSLIIALSLYGASAQTSFSPATGSVINAGSDTLHVSVPGYQAVVGIQFIAKKDSGTVGGAAVLYGTIDGQNYVSTGDTLILADVPTNTAIWKLAQPVYTKYRIVATGTGTMSATISAKAIARKH